jgi:DNA polymerase III, delta subunit, C terminal
VGNWAKTREESTNALIQSLYIKERARLLELMMLWFGDILRTQVPGGHDRLEFPDCTAAIQRAAQSFTPENLLQRLTHLEQLGRYYDTTVNEALAAEMCFLGAFS